MTDDRYPLVSTQLLIRRPAAEVFEAFVDPAVTTRFWFTGSSGRLGPGAVVTWEWEMYALTTRVAVTAFEPGRRLAIEWGDPPEPVEWRFAPRPGDTTLVTITSWGFRGPDDEILAQALDSKGGFTLVLAALKAWLEHGVQLNVVADSHPDDHRPPPDPD